MKLEVHTMTCGGCVNAVTRAVRKADPEAIVEADLAAKIVTLITRETPENVVALLAKAGHEAKVLAA